jgi:lysophospholipase L1-like esterase
MWDPFLIFFSKNPFAVCIVPLLFSACFSFLGKKFIKCQILGFTFFIIGICLGSILHFRWDSFSIHFCKISTKVIPPNCNILFIGDSITVEGTRPRGFITKLESVLQIESETISAKGATSVQIISLVENNTLNFRPDYIITQSGINDLISGISEKEVKRAQSKLLNSIHSTFPNAIVLYIPIHPFFKEKNFVIPSNRPSSKTQLYSWWGNTKKFIENYLFKDGIHLNAKGNTKLAEALAKKIISYKT